jgi:large subunit ribosomal protein L13
MTSVEKKESHNEIVIDATHAILGRLASFVAKKLLSGSKVTIVNCGNAIILGNKKNILKRYIRKRRLGKGTLKGPYFPRKPEAILKRTIRGMLPYKSAHGMKAFKNLKCYSSVPSNYVSIKKIVSKRKKLARYVTLGEISKLI